MLDQHKGPLGPGPGPSDKEGPAPGKYFLEYKINDQRHQMVSSSLALLYFLLSFHGGRQGSGPDRGQSPVEWGDFPFICSSVHPSVPPSDWLAGPQAWLDGPEGGTDGWTNG